MQVTIFYRYRLNKIPHSLFEVIKLESKLQKTFNSFKILNWIEKYDFAAITVGNFWFILQLYINFLVRRNVRLRGTLVHLCPNINEGAFKKSANTSKPSNSSAIKKNNMFTFPKKCARLFPAYHDRKSILQMFYTWFYTKSSLYQ